jgi:hypothetical protein
MGGLASHVLYYPPTRLGGAVPVRHTSRLLAGMFMHHIFPDHALVRRDCAVLLAVVGWKQRLAAFELWMADSYPEARLEYTSFDYLPFGPLSEIVFDHYDVILRICFPTEADARRSETLWPTRGPVAGPYAKLWPDNGPTPRKLEPFHSHLIRRLAHAKERRNAKKKNTGGSDPD